MSKFESQKFCLKLKKHNNDAIFPVSVLVSNFASFGLEAQFETGLGLGLGVGLIGDKMCHVSPNTLALLGADSHTTIVHYKPGSTHYAK